MFGHEAVTYMVEHRFFSEMETLRQKLLSAGFDVSNLKIGVTSKNDQTKRLALADEVSVFIFLPQSGDLDALRAMTTDKAAK